MDLPNFKATMFINSVDLLQKFHQLTSSPFVRFRQIDVFEVEHQPFAIFWSIHSSCIRTDGHTTLCKFLENVGRRSLCIAVNCGDLHRSQLAERMVQQEPGKIKIKIIFIGKSIQISRRFSHSLFVFFSREIEPYSFPQPSGPARMKGCLHSSTSNHLENKSKYLLTSGVRITGSFVVEKSSICKLSGT